MAIVRGARLSDVEPGRKAKRAAVAEAEARMAKIVSSARISDLGAERVQKALAALRVAGKSLAICNHYRTAIRSFRGGATSPTEPKKTPFAA